MLKNLSVAAGILIVATADAGGHKAPPGTVFNVQCPAREVLPKLDLTYHRCNNGDERSCKSFVELFRQALPESDCHRDFDEDFVVPALWLADAADEDYIRLLSRLRFREAQELFASPEFRAVLDGALLEEYGPKSEQAMRKPRSRQ